VSDPSTCSQSLAPFFSCNNQQSRSSSVVNDDAMCAVHDMMLPSYGSVITSSSISQSVGLSMRGKLASYGAPFLTFAVGGFGVLVFFF
jgi:hypothetical protein